MEKRYSGRRRRHLRWLWLLMIPVLAAGYTLWRFGPQRSYTARQLGLTDLQSPNDADGDGVDDWTDAVLGARAYIATDPHYQSKYYAGGYPDDGLGVCTDVIWQALQAAGYDLKALVDADIAACPGGVSPHHHPRLQYRLPPGQHLGYLLPPPCAGADLRPVGWAAVAAGGHRGVR